MRGVVIISRNKRNALLKEIRNCPDCKESIVGEGKHTPVVYSAHEPDILLVSEVPPIGKWKAGLGDMRIHKIGIPVEDPPLTTSAVLIDWLNLSRVDAENRFFWIQRINCVPIKEAKARIAKYCSEKYIAKAIHSIDNLTAIITIGKPATRWFFGRGKLCDMVNKRESYSINGREIPIIALFHPSSANRRHRADYRNIHEQSLKYARGIIGTE